jgi:uncharacterized protein (DUF924 family)
MNIQFEERIVTILDFWFGQINAEGSVQEEIAKRWWLKDAQFDQFIRHKFLTDINHAIKNDYNSWLTDAQGRLALIILIDQFCRNVYRNSSKAFDYDYLALEWALSGIKLQQDKQLKLIERVFFYLPLEHSENKEIQMQSVTLFKELYDLAPMQQKHLYKSFLDYAKAHQSIIERFGRFPYRNIILGRISTDEELVFLQQPNSSF